jgi:thioredoxin 1
MALEFTDANFQQTVIESDKLSVIDFWAEWCGPCRAIGPVIEELAVQYEGKVNIGKVNVDVNPTLSTKFGITSIPAILFVKGGRSSRQANWRSSKGCFRQEDPISYVIDTSTTFIKSCSFN